jgi:hypothetical protein
MMKRITRKWLTKEGACRDGKEWCLSYGELTIKELYPVFIKNKKHDWLNWLLVRLMNKKQKVMYAVFAAELVLQIFEKKHPKDDRPRKAIEAAKAYLKNPCAKTKKAAAYAAYDAYDAAYAAYDAAYAAAYAAAAYAAYAAYAAAAYAAYADAAVYTAAAAEEEMFIKILKYGYSLLVS